jgi:hypothetical protein
MPSEVFIEFIALLATVGIAAFTVIRVARLFAHRSQTPSTDIVERLEVLERALRNVQQELVETQERLDFTERLLSTAREERRIGG